jgi:hypothetical protein
VEKNTDAYRTIRIETCQNSFGVEPRQIDRKIRLRRHPATGCKNGLTQLTLNELKTKSQSDMDIEKQMEKKGEEFESSKCKRTNKGKKYRI